MFISPLSQQVLQQRRLRGEIGPQALDATNRRRYPLPACLVERQAVCGHGEAIRESWQGEWLRSELTPIRDRHVKGRQ